VDLEDDRYIIQIYPVGEVKNTPADRLQLIQELNAAGKVSDDALLQTIQYLDSAKELESVSRQRELVESYIDQWLDATPETEQDGTFRYRPPIPWMPSLPDALVQVAQSYLEAEMDEVPDYNKDFFLRFMQELDLEIQKKEQRAAQNAAGKSMPVGPSGQDMGADSMPLPPGPPGAGGPPPLQLVQ
jgi:hypothetical protein